ncbi:MAG: CsxC family protein [Bacillota bacterium]
MTKNSSFPGHSKKKQCEKSNVKSVSCQADSYKVPGGTYVPVILAYVNLKTDISSQVKLPSPAKEIKSIKKNVSLKKCEVLQHPGSRGKAKIFVKGTIHKNIQYVESCNGYLRDYSIDVPFTCIDEISLPGADRKIKSQKSSLNHEYKYSSKNKLGADPYKAGSFTHEYFNEPIECVLKSADIFEIDLYKDYDNLERFTTLTENMEVNLWLMLVQNQEHFSCHYKEHGESHIFEDKDYKEMEKHLSEGKPSITLLDLIKDRIDSMHK